MKALVRTAARWVACFLAGLVLPAGAARAVEQLPIIYTYEMQRQHDAARTIRRDPKSFWIGQILARIEDQREPTRVKLAAPKTVEVRFTVSRDGHLADSDVAASSGVTDLDKVALAMVKRADPFPPAPDALPDPSLTFALPVRFK